MLGDTAHPFNTAKFIAPEGGADFYSISSQLWEYNSIWRLVLRVTNDISEHCILCQEHCCEIAILC